MKRRYILLIIFVAVLPFINISYFHSQPQIECMSLYENDNTPVAMSLQASSNNEGLEAGNNNLNSSAFSIIQWIAGNSQQFKDITSALCTVFATFIAWLTYRKAKSTLFQSEVAKEQTRLLIEILNIFIRDKNMFMNSIYYDIILCNLSEHSKEHDSEISFFPINDDANIANETAGFLNGVQGMRNGYYILNLDTSGVGVFTDVLQELRGDDSEEQGEDFNDFTLGLIYITQSFVDLRSSLENYIYNPFLPSFVQNQLTLLLRQIECNIKGPLAKVFESNFKRIMQSSIDQVWPQAIHNDFLHDPSRIDHTPTIDSLILGVRKYLRIDSQR